MNSDLLPEAAVILAGGRGERLRPITDEIPKALIKVNGKVITEYNIDLFKKYDIIRIILSIGYLGQKIKDHFKDGKDIGVDITYIEEAEPLGTAGPLRLLKSKINSPFIVTNCDEIKDIDLTLMYRAHKKHKALITIALTKVKDPWNYGVAKLNGPLIVEFVEKPKMGTEPSNLINSGLYIIEPEILDIINDGYSMLETDVFPKIAKQGKLFGFYFEGQWTDIGKSHNGTKNQ